MSVLISRELISNEGRADGTVAMTRQKAVRLGRLSA